MKSVINLYFTSYRGLPKQAWMLAFVMLINRSGAMVMPFLGVYMTQSLHFSLKEAGSVLSCFGLGALLGSDLGGRLSDKAGPFNIQVFYFLASVPLFCILPQLSSTLSLSVGVFILSMITEAYRPANSVSMASFSQ